VAELSGFEVLGLLKEIGEALRGTYVNNIFRMGTSQLIRFRKQDSEDVWLVVSPKRGVWLSKMVKERTETTEFTTKLRGELERSRFLEAHQVDLDRVFELEFENHERRKLVVELMPPGNIIATDADNRVVVALQEVRTPMRKVARGMEYRPPSQSRISPAVVSEEEVTLMLKKEKTAGGAIGRHIALPRKYVSECLARLGLEDGSPSSRLEGREAEVVRTLEGMVEEARARPMPCICETDKGDEIFAFPPRGLKVKLQAANLSELCDSLFLEEATAEHAAPSATEARRREMETTISRLKAESASLQNEASRVRAAAEKARSSSMEDAVNILRNSGAKPTREPSSPVSVASVLFDHAKKLEEKSAMALESAERLEKKLPGASRKEPRRTTPLPKRKQEWYEKFRWFFTSGGKLAVGGRDAQSNALLVKRHLDPDDVVFHADLFGSPFFIAKGGRDQSEQESIEVAQATVSFSSGWKTGLGAADAYWVYKDQVSDSPESGEYLAKGSFVIRGKKNFIRRALLQVAVGIDESGRVMAGPESAVSRACLRYLVLAPSREKVSDTAKKVLKEMSAPGVALPLPTLDEVVRALPSGGGKIIRRKIGPAIRDKP
jgi:predicted ribosome quality control (RQC) complex YloA/Tae2 family protein